MPIFQLPGLIRRQSFVLDGCTALETQMLDFLEQDYGEKIAT